MKKGIVAFLVLTLLWMAGCSEDGPFTGTMEKPASETAAPITAAQTTAPTETAVPQTTAVPVTDAPTEPVTQAPTEIPAEQNTEPLDPWSLMGESMFEQGSYTDELGNNATYSYCLPFINADTTGAIEINVAIDSVFGAQVREAKEAMENGQSLMFYSCGYYGEVWNDVLSLVLIGHTDYGFDSYGVYCYESSTGRDLDTPELLERMGISQEQFLETCKIQFRAYFEDMYKDIPVDQRESYGYDMFLAKVDAPEYVNLGLMAYPNANGDLVVIAPIVSMAGAEYYYHPIIISFKN